MRNLIVLLFLAAAGYLVYTNVIKRDPPPIRAYKMVVDDWVKGNLSRIRPMCEEPRTETIFEIRSLNALTQPIGISEIIEQTYSNVTVTPGQSTAEMSVSGRLRIDFNPPGVKSAAYASFFAVFDITLGLRQIADTFKIMSVKFERVEMNENRKQ